MTDGNAVSRGDRNRNARLARLRELAVNSPIIPDKQGALKPSEIAFKDLQLCIPLNRVSGRGAGDVGSRIEQQHAAMEKQVTTASSAMLATRRNYSPIDKIVTLEP